MVALGQSADSASASGPGLCWQRVCPREESIQLQPRDTLSSRRGWLSGYGFISLVLFLATPNQVNFRCTTSVSGCVGGRLLPGEEVGWCAE